MKNFVLYLYNNVILELNELIPDLNQLYDNYDLDLAHNLMTVGDKMTKEEVEQNITYYGFYCQDQGVQYQCG